MQFIATGHLENPHTEPVMFEVKDIIKKAKWSFKQAFTISCLDLALICYSLIIVVTFCIRIKSVDRFLLPATYLGELCLL